MREFVLLAVVILAACASESPERSGDASGAPLASGLSTPAAVDLTGDWRVAGIDGEALDETYGIALVADRGHIWWEPGCAGQGRRFSISGNVFRSVPPQPPGEVCDIAFPDRLADVWRAIDAADTVRRSSSNGIKISGRGHSVLLFSQ